MRKRLKTARKPEANEESIQYQPTIVFKPRNKSQKQAMSVIDRNEITFLTGIAGTSKTFISVAYALDAIYNKRLDYRHIVMVRPLVDADEDPGALPGTLEEKAEPYLRPINDALSKLTNFDSRLLKPALDKVIQVRTLGTMRGLTFDNSICILDEAQNATKAQLKMFLTRLGENSKMIVAGDCDQTDIEYSVLEKASKVLSKNTGIGWFEFSPEDNCRNPLNKVVLDGMKEI